MRTYDLRTAQLYTEDIIHPTTSFSQSNTTTSKNYIAASCLDGIIRVWERSSSINNSINNKKKVYQKLHSSHKSNNYKVECTFTSNDEYVISGSECGNVAIYPVNLTNDDGSSSNEGAVKATILQRHKGPTTSVASCPQISRPWLFVSASYDGSAVVWASQAQYDCCSVDT